MSVKELKFTWPNGNKFEIEKHMDNLYHIRLGIDDIFIDHSQAHLLMLYLQEHLGFGIDPFPEKGLWLCGCGKYHAKDFVCERISKEHLK